MPQSSAASQQPLTRRALRALAAAAVHAQSQAGVDLEVESPPEPHHESADAFEQAARLFSFTDEVATPASAPRASHLAVAQPRIDTDGSGQRRARSKFRKLSTAGLSVGVITVVGAFAFSMSMPFVGGKADSASEPVAATAVLSTIDDSDIQAFVASSDVHNAPVDRRGGYSQVSAAEIAQETGINYSAEIFTNDRSAAIQWPFEVGVGVSYGYGMRDGTLHEGIDFVPGDGAPIQAIADGVVRIATEDGGAYGVNVYIDHVIDGQIITSHYAHMQYGSLQVVAGQHVAVGDVVGLTGNTGRSFGAHLHFELIVNGSTIDPMPWMREHAG